MSDCPKNNDNNHCSKNLPVPAPKNHGCTTATYTEDKKDEEEIDANQKVTLNADEEKRLKQHEYASGQPTHQHLDIQVKSHNMRNNNGRDHGNLQIQNRSQNH